MEDPGKVPRQAHRPEEAEDLSQPLQKVKLAKVNGFRYAIEKVLQRVAIVGGLGLAAGYAAGHAVEAKYHKVTGFDHNAPAMTEEPKTEAPDTETSQEETDGEKDQSALARLRKIATGGIQRAREKAGKTVKDLSENSSLVQKYREIRSEYEEFKRSMLEFGDKAAFWVPFLTIFLATVLLANKIIQVKKQLLEPVDPAVERNMKTIEAALNRLIRRANALSEANTGTTDHVTHLQADVTELQRQFEDQRFEP